MAFVLQTSVVQAQTSYTYPYTTSYQGGYYYPVSCVQLNQTLRFGMRDRAYTFAPGPISQLQSFLNSSGYLQVAPSGYFGVSTRKAVQQFQRNQGLVPNGVVNLATRNAIANISCANTGYPNPNNPQAFQLISPNGRENWEIGRTYDIRWVVPQVYVTNETVNIYLEREKVCPSGYYCTMEMPAPIFITSVPLVNGIYSLTLNPNQYGLQTGRYKVSIRSATGQYSDMSDDWISINTANVPNTGYQSIQVTYPNSGSEELIFGNDYTLRWTSTGFGSNDTAYVALQDSNGPLCYLGSAPMLSQVFSFRPAQNQPCLNQTALGNTIRLNTGYYKVFISNKPITYTGYSNWYEAIKDESDAYFRLGTGSNSNSTGITVSIQSSNSVFKPGDSIAFSWNPNANTGPLYAYLYDNQGRVIYSKYLVAYGAGDSSILIPTDVSPGSYRIAVIDQGSTYGQRIGYSNYFNVTTAGTTVWVDLTNPIGGEVWYRNSNQSIRFSSANIPSGAYAVVRLTSVNGTTGTLKQVQVPSNGIIDVRLDTLYSGDIANVLQPGQYTLFLDIYDRSYCEGYCPSGTTAARRLGGDSVGYVTIY